MGISIPAHSFLLALLLLTGCGEAPSLDRTEAKSELSGCKLLDSMADDRASADPRQLKLISEAKESYRKGQYGVAEAKFRKATEDTAFGMASTSRVATLEAWYGLAASYDQLRRFDLADPVYEHIRSSYGESVTYFNNYGYSLRLRGDRAGARREFEKAMRFAPTCQITRNNLAALESD